MSSGDRKILNAEEIFVSQDLPRQWVPTPEWKPAGTNGIDCGVFITTLDAAEKERWEDEITNAAGKTDSSKIGVVMASAIARSCVDENGERIFSMSQVDRLSKKSGVVVTRLWSVFRQLNVMTDTDVGELAKN